MLPVMGVSVRGDAVPVSTRCHRKSHHHLPFELASTADHKTRRQPPSVRHPSLDLFLQKTQEGVNRKEQREVHRAQEHPQGRTWTSQARPGCAGSWGSWRGCPGVQVCPWAARARAALKRSGSGPIHVWGPWCFGRVRVGRAHREEPQREHLQLVSRQPREPAGRAARLPSPAAVPT